MAAARCVLMILALCAPDIGGRRLVPYGERHWPACPLDYRAYEAITDCVITSGEVCIFKETINEECALFVKYQIDNFFSKGRRLRYFDMLFWRDFRRNRAGICFFILWYIRQGSACIKSNAIFSYHSGSSTNIKSIYCNNCFSRHPMNDLVFGTRTWVDLNFRGDHNPRQLDRDGGTGGLSRGVRGGFGNSEGAERLARLDSSCDPGSV